MNVEFGLATLKIGAPVSNGPATQRGRGVHRRKIAALRAIRQFVGASTETENQCDQDGGIGRESFQQDRFGHLGGCWSILLGVSLCSCIAIG